MIGVTTGNTGANGTALLDYPTGFTNSNSRVISAGINNGGVLYVNDTRIGVYQQSAKIQVSTETAAFYNKDCYAVLIKIA